MTFTNDQLVLLNAPLDGNSVKTRKQAGFELSYIEGWHAIAEANRIFGHEGWDRKTELTQCGEPEEVDGKWRVRYMAKVEIAVRAGDTLITRHGIGYGSGIAKDQGDAFEGAIKEAETDATKRALMTFGWPFGLALYDKTREHVMTGPPRLTKQKARTLYETMQAEIREAKTTKQLDDWGRNNNTKAATLPADWEDSIRAEFRRAYDELRQESPEKEEAA